MSDEIKPAMTAEGAAKRVQFTVTLRHVPSGYTWAHHYDVEERYVGSQWFLWHEGNYSCDCNRMIFLHTDHGAPNPIDQTTCGRGEFALLSIAGNGSSK